MGRVIEFRKSTYRLKPMKLVTKTSLVLSLLTLLSTNEMLAQDSSSLIGRWNLEVQARGGKHPSWLEVRKSGKSSLVGSFVGQFGSARPVAKIEVQGSQFRFSLPPQWEDRRDDLVFLGALSDGQISGTTTDEKGNTISWSGHRAPTLNRDGQPSWGASQKIFNGSNLDGWHARFHDKENGWEVIDGILTNKRPGNDLITNRTFQDFRLHAEFRYPKGSNSGIYLRGRYEMQIEDNYGDAPECHKIGGIYGFLTPSFNASRPAGQWQSVDITLVGRVITVILNGTRVIDNQTIPGPTGGALDNDEAIPGPLMIQGDHGPVEFRELSITPAL